MRTNSYKFDLHRGANVTKISCSMISYRIHWAPRTTVSGMDLIRVMLKTG